MTSPSLLWTVGWILTIQQIEENVITPFIQKRAVAIPPVVVLFAIGVFGLLFGLPGVFLAVPLAVDDVLLPGTLQSARSVNLTGSRGRSAKPSLCTSVRYRRTNWSRVE
ncbi:AI-2E family transporter [Microvirga sp. BSC39]|uniref:AI-2E family transporter n=1 Tax=Microvirga sp. BSC39 TaxID=1549810 RepID=UPI0004E8726E|nr:AI-2E family transporter [Microvirga sp. BSC39]KFG69358.1 hypothetical protein JH26_11050 [Microvirga sp. BSC39]